MFGWFSHWREARRIRRQREVKDRIKWIDCRLEAVTKMRSLSGRMPTGGGVFMDAEIDRIYADEQATLRGEREDLLEELAAIGV